MMYPQDSSETTKNIKPLRQELFSSPFVSVLYERVLPPLWNAGLRAGGPQQEYSRAASFLNQGDMVLDLSCGTGFVGRRMAASNKHKHVFLVDYSKQMLNECLSTIQDQGEKDLPLSIIQADAGRLPFVNDSIDAVHWGAAMHCVPNAEQALSQVYRVLKPGGKLYATTFLRPFPDFVFRFFDERQLEEMAQKAGFTSVQVERQGLYGILRAIKPNAST